jgi:hypothetical protein
MAAGARVGNLLAGAMAGRAGLLDGEEALAHPHLAVTTAGGAGLGLGARLGTGAVAHFAVFMRRNADLLFAAAGSLFQRDVQVVAQVGTTIDIGTATASATTATAEDVAEDVAKSPKPPKPAPPPPAPACGSTPAWPNWS